MRPTDTARPATTRPHPQAASVGAEPAGPPMWAIVQDRYGSADALELRRIARPALRKAPETIDRSVTP